MATKRIVKYGCPLCNNSSKKYKKEDLVIHITDNHENELPEDFTPFRYVFNYVNKKPLSYHGKCTECGGPTEWDENKGRYNRQCGKKACHDSFVKKFEENMVKTKGVTRISKTAEGQVQMLANRKISGSYKFKNGVEKTYTGSYEKKAFEFMDKVMNINPDDLMCPGLILEYTFDGKKYMYITDFYYQPYDLVIEVKDGGNNPNKRNMPVYRAKQEAKEEYIIKHTKYNYLRLTDNDFSQLLSTFFSLKMEMVDNTQNRVIHVNESFKDEESPIHELMTAAAYTPVVGMRDSGAYIINLPKNNVFDSEFGITNKYMDRIFGLDKDSNLCKLDEDDDKEEYKKIKEYVDLLYRLDDSISEVSAKLSKILGENMTQEELYKVITETDLYTIDQISAQFNAVLNEYSTVNNIRKTTFIENTLSDYILGKNEVDSILESAEEVIRNNG